MGAPETVPCDVAGYELLAGHWPGPPPVLVLVHGFGAGNTFERLAWALFGHADIWVPDLPGFGHSEAPPHPMGAAALGQALGRWMEILEIVPDVVVGRSFGCQVTTELAVQQPVRCPRLVLLSPTFDPRARSVPAVAARLLRTSTWEPPSIWALQLRNLRRAGVVRTWRTLRLALEDRIEERLPQVTAPTLVVHGEHGHLVGRRWAEQVTALLPTASLVTLPGGGHALGFDRPTATAAVIREWVGEQR